MAHGVTGSIFEAFVFAIRDEYATDAQAPAIATTHWLAGRLEGAKQTSAPSMRFRRPSGTTQAASSPGPHAFPDNSGYFSSRYEDLATIEVDMKAIDWIQLDCMRTGLLAATWNTLFKSSTPGAWNHLSEDTADPDPYYQTGGQMMIQRFEWQILIPHVIGSLAEINTIVGTSEFHNVNPAPGTPGPPTTQT